MNYLILLRGCPASGKSTWIKNNNLEAWTLSADAIRLLHQSPILTVDGGYSISPKNDNHVWNTLFDLLEHRMIRGEATIIDATNSSPAQVSRYKRLVDEYRYRCYIVDFSHVSLETCLEQNRGREPHKFVPEDVIEKLHSRILSFDPPKWATLIKPENFWSNIERWPLDYTSRFEQVVVFGDSHSCFDPIQKYFQGEPEQENTLYIHLGDMFDRGPQTEEWARFLLEHFNRHNWVFLQSNHNLHLTNWAFDRKVKSNEFLFNTAPALEKVADKKVWRTVARKFWQQAHFTFGSNEYLLTHGGLSKMPGPREMPLIASNEFYRGVGKYESVLDVAQSWDKNSRPNQYQIFGHRSTEETKNLFFLSNRTIGLDGKVELGNCQKILKIDKRGTFTTLAIKNDNIRTKYRTNIENVVAPLSNEDFLSSLRSHKGVRENKMGHISSWNFKNKVFYNRSWDNISEIARGLFINNETGNVIARGWNKTFRVHERPETQPEALRESLIFPCAAFHKYNGFLGLLGYDNKHKELVFCTKSSIDNDYSRNFERILRTKHGEHLDEIEHYLSNSNKCLAFEVIDPQNDPHIIEYKTDHVVLLECFERSIPIQTLPYDELCEKAIIWEMPCKLRNYIFSNWDQLESFIKRTEKYRENDIEGYMIEDATGYSFKVKTGFYSAWKQYRGFVQGLSKGHKIPYHKLDTPHSNEFIAWASKLSREELHASIIALRNRFKKSLTVGSL